VLRALGGALLMVGLFFVAGKRSPADHLAIFLGIGFGASLLVPLGIWRDRLEGTLDFLCGLPVEASSIAASRFIVVALGALPWSIGVAIAAARLPAEYSLNPIAVAIVVWLLFTLVGACLAALIAKFGIEGLAGWPVIAIGSLTLLGPRLLRHFVPGFSAKQLFELAQRPYASAAAAAILLIMIGLLGTLAFEVTTRAIASFRHDTSQL